MNLADQAIAFLTALSYDLRSDERLICCSFAGDPYTADNRAWRPKPWKPGDLLVTNPATTNGYVAISSFHRSADGTWRRRIDNFSRGLALMVDDIGTGIGSKAKKDIVAGLPPSAIIETSPNNFQYIYFLEPFSDKAVFDAVIKDFIHTKLMGSDTGMNGVNRVCRIPGFINGKQKYIRNGKPWTVQMRELNDNRYGIKQICEAFNLKPNARLRRAGRNASKPQDYQTENLADFARYFTLMRRWGMLKHNNPNLGNWMEIHCPWREGHSDRVNTGAGISEPSKDNDFVGAFKCHHGSCEGRGWADLTDYIVEICAEHLASCDEEEFYGRYWRQ